MGGAVRANINTVLPDAEARYRAGDYAASAALLAPLVEQTPPQPSALRILGLCRLRQGAPRAGAGSARACLQPGARVAS